MKYRIKMMPSSIFKKTKKKDFVDLINRCNPYIEIDTEAAYDAAISLVKAGTGVSDLTPENNEVKKLERRWYDSLSFDPDYSVYNDPFYISDIWACWLMYSRKSLIAIKHERSLVTQSVVDYIGDIDTVVDAGCGFGYTTAGLKELFPNADVVGTNLEDSYQFKIAEQIGSIYGFRILPDMGSVKKDSLVFASEYFEHFINPIEHAYMIVQSCHPLYFITANGFNGTAIGHFNYYTHMGKYYDSKTMNRMFNKAMTMMGYKRVKTKIWNNRPAFWQRIK